MGPNKRWVIGGVLVGNLVGPIVIPAIRLVASRVYAGAHYVTTRLSPTDCALLLIACGLLIVALGSAIRHVVSTRPAPPPTPTTPQERLARRLVVGLLAGNILPHVTWPIIRRAALGVYNTYETIAANLTPQQCAAILAAMFMVIAVLVGVLHRALQRPVPAAPAPATPVAEAAVPL